CSSSLVAVHLACQSILSGEAEFAICGGINLFLSPETHIILAKAGMLSPSGTCKAFDAGADGYVRSEGAGLILLKSLDAAIANGDSILGVIEATGINHDGHSQGLTAPSGTSQKHLIEEVGRKAGLALSQIS